MLSDLMKECDVISLCWDSNENGSETGNVWTVLPVSPAETAVVVLIRFTNPVGILLDAIFMTVHNHCYTAVDRSRRRLQADYTCT